MSVINAFLYYVYILIFTQRLLIWALIGPSYEMGLVLDVRISTRCNVQRLGRWVLSWALLRIIEARDVLIG